MSAIHRTNQQRAVRRGSRQGKMYTNGPTNNKILPWWNNCISRVVEYKFKICYDPHSCLTMLKEGAPQLGSPDPHPSCCGCSPKLLLGDVLGCFERSVATPHLSNRSTRRMGWSDQIGRHYLRNQSIPGWETNTSISTLGHSWAFVGSQVSQRM